MILCVHDCFRLPAVLLKKFHWSLVLTYLETKSIHGESQVSAKLWLDFIHHKSNYRGVIINCNANHLFVAGWSSLYCFWNSLSYFDCVRPTNCTNEHWAYVLLSTHFQMILSVENHRIRGKRSNQSFSSFSNQRISSRRIGTKGDLSFCQYSVSIYSLVLASKPLGHWLDCGCGQAESSDSKWNLQLAGKANPIVCDCVAPTAPG